MLSPVVLFKFSRVSIKQMAATSMCLLREQTSKLSMNLSKHFTTPTINTYQAYTKYKHILNTSTKYKHVLKLYLDCYDLEKDD